MEPLKHLTKNETKIIAAMMNGYTTDKELSAHMDRTVSTIKSNIKIIKQKLHVNDRAKIILFGIAAGLRPVDYEQMMERINNEQ